MTHTWLSYVYTFRSRFLHRKCSSHKNRYCTIVSWQQSTEATQKIIIMYFDVGETLHSVSKQLDFLAKRYENSYKIYLKLLTENPKRFIPAAMDKSSKGNAEKVSKTEWSWKLQYTADWDSSNRHHKHSIFCKLPINSSKGYSFDKYGAKRKSTHWNANRKEREFNEEYQIKKWTKIANSPVPVKKKNRTSQLIVAESALIGTVNGFTYFVHKTKNLYGILQRENHIHHFDL